MVKIVAGITAVAGILVLLQGTRFFILNVPDDGYYYLVVARNLAKGMGSTFDGVSLTNGYHPLLAFLLAGIFHVIPEIPLGDLRVAIALGILFHLLTGWILVLAMRRIGAAEHAELAGILYWLNPYAFLRSFGNMEPPLYALCLTMLLYLLLRFTADFKRPGGKILVPVLLGLVAGLTLLARTDAIFLVPLVGLYVLFTRPAGTRPALMRSLLFGTAVTLVVFPWVLYSWKHFDTVWQYSGMMKSFERWGTVNAMSVGAAVLETGNHFWIWIRKSLMTAPLMKYVFLVFLFGGIGFLGRKRRSGSRFGFRDLKTWFRSIPTAVWIYVLFIVIVGTYYSVSYRLIRGWYLVPSSILMSLISVHALRHYPVARTLWRSAAARRIVVGLLLAESILYPAVKLGRGIQREQADTFRMVEWASAHLDSGTRIGCFNAGIPAYFLDNPVVNLDGLMNNEMLGVFREKNLGPYLERRRIKYILDHEGMGPVIRNLAGEAWATAHLREHHSLPGPEKNRRLVIWEIY